MPAEPEDATNRITLIKWELDMKKHYDDLSDCNDGVYSLCALTNGQGSELSKVEVKAIEGHEDALKTKNCVWLLDACEATLLKCIVQSISLSPLFKQERSSTTMPNSRIKL